MRRPINRRRFSTLLGLMVAAVFPLMWANAPIGPLPVRAEQPPADPTSLVTIYSDLGTGTNVYLPNIGWSVTGPEVVGGKVDSATPFTPKRNSKGSLLTNSKPIAWK